MDIVIINYPCYHNVHTKGQGNNERIGIMITKRDNCTLFTGKTRSALLSKMSTVLLENDRIVGVGVSSDEIANKWINGENINNLNVTKIERKQ